MAFGSKGDYRGEYNDEELPFRNFLIRWHSTGISFVQELSPEKIPLAVKQWRLLFPNISIAEFENDIREVLMWGDILGNEKWKIWEDAIQKTEEGKEIVVEDAFTVTKVMDMID